MGLVSSKCTSAARLNGKTAVVTGSNTGIGKTTAEDFFKRGARVILACRSIENGNVAAEEIKSSCKGQTNIGEIVVAELDLASLNSVRNCAQHLLESEKRIDLLINNAGVMACPYSKTKDGFEMQFGVNHLGPFLLTLLLLPKMIESKPARVVNISSVTHNGAEINFDDLNFEKRPYSALQAYKQSKLANIMFAAELAIKRKAAGIEGVTVYSLHPGVIATELGRHLDATYFRGLRWIFRNAFGMFIKTPEQGAQTTIYCAVDENAGKETGLYYAECKVTEPSLQAKKVDDAKKLWDISAKLVGLDANFDPFASK